MFQPTNWNILTLINKTSSKHDENSDVAGNFHLDEFVCWWSLDNVGRVFVATSWPHAVLNILACVSLAWHQGHHVDWLEWYNTPLKLTASLWKLFEILSYEILETEFGFSTKNLGLRGVFMLLLVIVSTPCRCKVCKSVMNLTVKNDSGYEVSLRTIFHG